MDLHSNASSAPVRNAEHRSYNASDSIPGSDAWLAGRHREEAAIEDLEARKSAPFPEDVMEKLAPFAGSAKPPKGFDRTLRIRRS